MLLFLRARGMQRGPAWKCTCRAPLFWHSMDPYTASTRPKMPPQHGVAPEGVGAGVLRAGAVRALRAAADAEEAAHGQLHEHAEAVGARQRVLGQHGAPLVVGRELRQERLRVQRVVLHVQLGLGTALELAAASVVLEGRVRLSGSGQPEHERVVPFGRGERDEERGAVADPVASGAAWSCAPRACPGCCGSGPRSCPAPACVRSLDGARGSSWVAGLLFLTWALYIALLLVVFWVRAGGLSGCCRQPRHVSDLGKVSLHGPVLVVDVQVLAVVEGLLDLLQPFHDLQVRQAAVPAAVFVGLGVHCCRLTMVRKR